MEYREQCHGIYDRKWIRDGQVIFQSSPLDRWDTTPKMVHMSRSIEKQASLLRMTSQKENHQSQRENNRQLSPNRFINANQSTSIFQTSSENHPACTYPRSQVENTMAVPPIYVEHAIVFFLNMRSCLS